MSEELIELPPDWIEVSLENIAYRITKGTTPTSLGFRFADTGILFVKVESLSSQRINHELCAFIGTDADEALSRSRLQENDVLFSIAGTLGRVAVVHRDDLPANTNQAICIIRLVPPISSKYIAQFLSSPLIEKRIQESRRGVGLQNLNLKQVSGFQVSLSPLNEQKRIADKLDRLLARVDACRERCDRIPLILKRFRQSVLAAATSGELTEDWADSHESWSTSPLGELLSDVRYGTAKKTSYEGGGDIPVIRIPNIQNGRIDTHDLKYGEFDEKEIETLLLREGDILIIRSNGSVELVGKAAVVGPEIEGYLFAGYLIRLRVKKELINPQYLYFFLSSPSTRQHIEITARSTSGVNNINSEEIRSIEVDLPSLDEQHEIVRRVETLFAFADRLEARYQTARAQIDRLTPAVLDKAFRGELVPQDPNDEPASILLEQIRSELATAKTNKSERGKRVPVETTPSLAQVIMLTRKDVQPSHLSAILKTRGSLAAEDLWTASQLEIDDFYDQLKDEEEQGLLRETRGEEPNAPRLLEAA